MGQEARNADLDSLEVMHRSPKQCPRSPRSLDKHSTPSLLIFLTPVSPNLFDVCTIQPASIPFDIYNTAIPFHVCTTRSSPWMYAHQAPSHRRRRRIPSPPAVDRDDARRFFCSALFVSSDRFHFVLPSSCRCRSPTCPPSNHQYPSPQATSPVLNPIPPRTVSQSQ